MNPKFTSSQPDVPTFISNLEAEHDARLAATKVHNRHLSEYIPADLRVRLAKFIKLSDLLPATAEDRPVDVNAADEDGPDELHSDNDHNGADGHSQRSLRESTITEVCDRERQFETLSLHLDPPPQPRKPPVRQLHWLSKMRDQRKVERICWPSKIHRFDKMFSQLSLFDQAEQMMDWGADDFVAWLATIGDPDEVSTLTPDIVKQLFSIGAEGDASKALYVEPTLRKAIPHAMANAMGIPKLSLDYNVCRLLRSDERSKLRPSHRLAFGRSQPRDDCFEGCADGIRPVVPHFPEAMLSKRSIFEGITHLRATNTLVDHMRAHRELRRPPYLREQGMFDERHRGASGEMSEKHVPLHRDFVKREAMM